MRIRCNKCGRFHEIEGTADALECDCGRKIIVTVRERVALRRKLMNRLVNLFRSLKFYYLFLLVRIFKGHENAAIVNALLKSSLKLFSCLSLAPVAAAFLGEDPLHTIRVEVGAFIGAYIIQMVYVDYYLKNKYKTDFLHNPAPYALFGAVVAGFASLSSVPALLVGLIAGGIGWLLSRVDERIPT
jgi:DNA-directed RNA polymerase subunit RPC12/RpoP